MCAQVHYTKDLFTLVLFSPMENKLSQFCKSCHKDVLFIFLFIAICFWQWFTVHSLRETAQNCKPSVNFYCMWPLNTADWWSIKTVGTRYYKHTSPKGQWRLHSLCPKLPHITACPLPLCLTQYLPSNEFQIVFVNRKKKTKNWQTGSRWRDMDGMQMW